MGKRRKTDRDFDNEVDDFGEFSLGNMRPGRVVPGLVQGQELRLRYRQGGDAVSWGQTGTTKYAPRGMFVQIGSISWSGAAATSGSKTFAFPVSFYETPLIFVTVVNTTPLFQDVRLQASSDGPGMEIYWFSTNPLTLVWFHWMAIGPGGV